MAEKPTGTADLGAAPTPLPMADQPPPERADAARNRERILDVAAELVARDGIDDVSMDAIAEAAGVGKGTLFRRFGNRAGLALALLDETERRFQESLLRGDPPLGPGAEPRERIAAFLEALGEHRRQNHQLLEVAEREPGGLYGSPVFAGWYQHLVQLLRQAAPGLDVEVLAHLLTAPYAAGMHTHLIETRGLDRERVQAAERELLDRMLG